MELFRSLFKQNAENISSSTASANIFFRDFGMLEFEKYFSLKNYGSAKKTWFFRIDFRQGKKAARYLFFFGSPSRAIATKEQFDVTLHISRESPAGSFHYERLDAISAPNVPSFCEIGYKPDKEKFAVVTGNGRTQSEKVEAMCREFFEEVINKELGGQH